MFLPYHDANGSCSDRENRAYKCSHVGQFHPDQLNIVAILPELLELRLGVDQDAIYRLDCNRENDRPRLNWNLVFLPIHQADRCLGYTG
jgi:hypothetical protein